VADAQTALQPLAEFLVTNLVDHPEGVRISLAERYGVTTFEVDVADGDLGQVIGRRGRVANALRQTMKAAGQKAGCKVSLEILS